MAGSSGCLSSSETPRALSFFRESTARLHSLCYLPNLWAGDDCASSTLGTLKPDPSFSPSVPRHSPVPCEPQWTQELGFRKKGHRWQVWPWRSQSFLPPTSFCSQPWMLGSSRILLELHLQAGAERRQKNKPQGCR